MKMHTSPSGCVQASGVEIYFQAQTQMTRIDWKPDRPTCAAKAWTERRSLIESHEAKHVKSVNDAVKSGNAAWVKSGAFEACGRNAKQKVANQIVALFKKTFRALTDQIAKSADALDLRERVEPLDCKATAGCHAQSTVQYTGRWAAGGFEDEDACVQLANPGTDTFTGELQGDEHLLTGDFKRTVAMPYCNWKGGTEHFKWCVLMITGSQTVSLELRPKDMEIQGRGIIRVINISPHAVDSLRFTISGDCFGTADTENDGDTREEIERILKQDLSHTYYMPTHDIPMPPNSELRLRPGRYESKEGTNATATLDLTGFTNSSP